VSRSGVRRISKADGSPRAASGDPPVAPATSADIDSATGLDQIIALAADLLEAPMGFISFPAQGRHIIRAQFGITGPLRPADIFLPPKILESSEFVVITDTGAAPNHSMVPATALLGARSVVAVPLGAPGTANSGMLCLFDIEPRPHGLDDRALRRLRALAAMAGSQRERDGPSAQRDAKSLRAAAFGALAEGMIRWSADRRGRLLDVSVGWTRLTGKPMTQAMGRGWLRQIHPEDRRKLLAPVSSARGLSDARIRIRASDGTWRWTRSRLLCSHDPIAGATWFGVIEDVHDLVLADEKLRTSEARLSTVFSQAMVGILHRDLNGRVLTVNKRFCDLIGRIPEELNHLPLRAITHADDAARNAEQFRAHCKTGTPFQIEKRYVRPDGSDVWCAVHVSFVRDANGNVQSAISVAQDISERRLAEQALRESEENYRHSVELSPQIPWTARPDGSIEEVGPLWYALTGHGVLQPLEGGWVEALHPEDVPLMLATWQRAIALGEPADIEYRVRTANGEYRWMRARAAPRIDDKGAIVRWYGTLEDIHDRRLAQQASSESEKRLRLAVQAARLGIWDYDSATCDSEWSAELLDMLGLPIDTVPTMETALRIVHPDDRQRLQSIVDTASSGQLPNQFEVALRIRRADDGAERWLKSTGWKTVTGSERMSRLIVTFQDVTEERNADARIRWAARHDPLTKLPNRTALQEELELAAAHCDDAGERLGLLLFDVDDLKRINDTLGHDAGDALLRTFAARLVEFAPENATVGRLGGDEFAIVVPAISGKAALDACASAILQGLRTPFAHQGRALDCAASVGASIFPDHGSDAAELLKSADLALYEAKTAARGRTIMFRSDMRAGLQRRSSMINMAKDAIRGDRIDPFYQPKIDLATNRLVGFEALLRWEDARGGVHLPEAISAAFGDTDLAIAITDRMLERVTADLRSWLDAGFDPVSIAVNSSANDFRYDDFAERVLERLLRCGLPPSCLEIEITETVFLGRGAGYVERALQTFSSAGIRIALDDFGTGYASLSHLKQYPVDIIKIDRSFVSNLENSPGDAAIVDAIVSLGRNLGITTVAEGVETEAQADHLRSRGCTIGQGFLFGRPCKAAEVAPVWKGRT
jgi:diguanylate cyclase (GGDEF)-like protein/PAS domain S-box-containing protein